MAMTVDTLSVTEILNLRGPVGSRITPIASSELIADSSILEALDFSDWRIHDAFNTFLPSTSSSNDLGLYPGTFGTNGMLIRTADVKTTTVTNYARFLCVVPSRYVAGASFKIRFYAGMETAVADGSATIDLEAYKLDGEGGISADLCATAAMTMNSLTYGNKDFTITPSTLVAGDILDCRVAIAIVDAAGASAVIGSIGKAWKLLTLQG